MPKNDDKLNQSLQNPNSKPNSKKPKTANTNPPKSQTAKTASETAKTASQTAKSETAKTASQTAKTASADALSITQILGLDGAEQEPEKEDYTLDLSADSKHSAYEPQHVLDGVKAVKGSFDALPQSQSSLSVKPIWQYEQVTQKALERQRKALEISQQSFAKTESTAGEQAKAPKNAKKSKRDYKPATRAHGNYTKKGDVTGVIARNETDLRAVQITREKKRITAIIIIILFLIFLIVFGMSLIINNTTGFTVNMTGNQGERGLTLYDNGNFENGTSKLVTTDIPKCDNQTYSELYEYILNVIDKGDGQQSEEHLFFAYSFYVQNVSERLVDFDFRLTMNSAVKGVDDAIRIALIKDSIYYGAKGNNRAMQIFAKPDYDKTTGKWLLNSDGKPVMQTLFKPDGKPFPPDCQDNASPFYSNDTPIAFSVKNLSGKKGADVLKYTVVIYLEGGDPDCTNALSNGGVKCKVNLNVTKNKLE